jgi:superfamily II DNA/RNA helicase/very-short-patch-repair endonuclease
MDVFAFRERVIEEYARFTRSFTKIKADDLRQYVDEQYARERFWPSPYIQLNPAFVPGPTVEELAAAGALHTECRHIFRRDKKPGHIGETLRLHRHQEEAVLAAKRGESYVLTTGTGSGKSLAYFIPIIDHVLRRRESGDKAERIFAIVVYPMNALCNSQEEELRKFLREGYGEGQEPVRFARYTGQEDQDAHDRLRRRPPDILLTNYVMLELLLTRQQTVDQALVRHAQGLDFLVLDELHTYRGRQGADVAMLVRRARNRFNDQLLCIGTSATMSSQGVGEARAVVARFATRLFGAPVKPENIITETLARSTPERVPTDAAALAEAIRAGVPESATYDSLRAHPVAAWIETRLGLQRDESDGKWARIRRPLSMNEAAQRLAEESGEPFEACREFLAAMLLKGYQAISPQGHRLFAFRLHQFISGAGDLFCTLEPPGARHATLEAQEFRPGDRGKRLFNVVFCRDCGQEYHPVWAGTEKKKPLRFEPRPLNERTHEDGGDHEFGFFMPDPDGLFDVEDLDSEQSTYPEEWIEGDPPKLRSYQKRFRPQAVQVMPDGKVGDGLPGWYIPTSFKFCLACGAYYGTSVRSDLVKLASLTAEGRSSATTVLTWATLRYLFADAAGLNKEAQKLLAFTDNRQDAALQAGHFNDFILVLLLRGALLAAIRAKGELRDENVTQAVQEHLRLEPPDFAGEGITGQGLSAAESALRDVLGYRLYHDLRRGWRFTHPNLEKLGLLEIGYAGLEELCADPAAWRDAPPLLATASPEQRAQVARGLLDAMRQGRSIKTIYLDENHQEQIRNRSHNSLSGFWALDPDERLEPAVAMVPRSSAETGKIRGEIHNVGFRSVFGRALHKRSNWGAHYPKKFDEAEYHKIVDDLLAVLARNGFVESVKLGRGPMGYLLKSSVLRWREAGGTGEGSNAFFRALYKSLATLLQQGDRGLHRMEAHEHTAQVDADDREKREEDFRHGTLPVLYCSPTMELGVDIATLNTVYLRNVPPTPANYAQRSGRAGRAGQPALVIAYCAARSPHDQYFFQDPPRMVSGVVEAPSIDLANEELIRSHLHAVWLAETGAGLDNSVQACVDLSKEPEYPLREDLARQTDSDSARERAGRRALDILAGLGGELTPDLAPWKTDQWLPAVINGAARNLDNGFNRWRSMMRATTRQMDRAYKTLRNQAIGPTERKEAERLFKEAEDQLKLLKEQNAGLNSDFFTYRYLANEGFLPGYNFPRLPLLAYLPGRLDRSPRQTYLSRPRFLGLSEFGPQSIIYHEGNTYRVRQAVLRIQEREATGKSLLALRAVKLCPNCGYMHQDEDKHAETCDSCGALLNGGRVIEKLFRIEQVSTRRAFRITSDEEERQRQGYEMLTTLRFAESNGISQFTPIIYTADGQKTLEVKYAPSATLWRINLGWRRRKNPTILGFYIDVTTGRWAKDDNAPLDTDDEHNPMQDAKVVEQIVPYVEERKNCLIVFPPPHFEDQELVTFQYALKRGIEVTFQLEPSELASEALPDASNRHAILFYESAEGGAGVLSRIASEPNSIRLIARNAIEACHYKSRSEEWSGFGDLVNQIAECEAGCYRCLLSYTNQPEHRLINRQSEIVRDELCRLTRATAERGEAGRTREDLRRELNNASVSSLEREWVTFIDEKGLHLPDRVQPLLAEFGTRADFGYSKVPALVYIDGPHHDSDHQRRIDEAITQHLQDRGYTVVRFSNDRDAWLKTVEQFVFVFGKLPGQA